MDGRTTGRQAPASYRCIDAEIGQVDRRRTGTGDQRPRSISSRARLAARLGYNVSIHAVAPAECMASSFVAARIEPPPAAWRGFILKWKLRVCRSPARQGLAASSRVDYRRNGAVPCTKAVDIKCERWKLLDAEPAVACVTILGACYRIHHAFVQKRTGLYT